ncbi:MAG: phage integrase SAM-like domain-containing protein [Dysgonamonadaceae bacterium]|jgi:hypothetical protein|nr:phage integrase SAM-like domain-containing protein [Dysgonamonadaceae bacterium]
MCVYGRKFKGVVLPEKRTTESGFVTAECLKNALRGIGTNHNTVMQEFSLFLEEKKKSTGIRISGNTYIQYCKGFRHLKNFQKDKLSVDDIPFGKVDIALIEDYAYYLKVDLKMAARSVHSFMALALRVYSRNADRFRYCAVRHD